MPHLAPLSWAIAPLLFMFILLTIMNYLWWSPSILHPTKLSSYSLPVSMWNWKYASKYTVVHLSSKQKVFI